MGFRVLVSLHPAIQATGRLTLAPAGLPPAEHTSLHWTHDRTIEFLNRASTLEGKPELAQTIISNSIFDPSKPTSVSDVVHAVREGRANAGVVYYSAAVATEGLVGIIRFPASTNMSEAIRNAASVPSNAKNQNGGIDFVNFLLTPEAQNILKATGQPPVVPAIRRGDVPPNIRN